MKKRYELQFANNGKWHSIVNKEDTLNELISMCKTLNLILPNTYRVVRKLCGIVIKVIYPKGTR